MPKSQRSNKATHARGKDKPIKVRVYYLPYRNGRKGRGKAYSFVLPKPKKTKGRISSGMEYGIFITRRDKKGEVSQFYVVTLDEGELMSALCRQANLFLKSRIRFAVCSPVPTDYGRHKGMFWVWTPDFQASPAWDSLPKPFFSPELGVFVRQRFTTGDEDAKTSNDA